MMRRVCGQGSCARGQIGDDFLAVRGHGFAPGMKIDLASTFQKSLNSLVKRDESLIALAYIFFTSGAKSAFSTRPRSAAIQSETGIALVRRSSRMAARRATVASISATG